MSDVYPCIGGPEDGKARAVANGCPEFFVAERPSMPVRPWQPGAEPRAMSFEVKRHRYQLCEVPGVGLAWMHQP